MTTAKLDACGHRWVAALANYNFKIHYRSGKLNVEADALSRLNTCEQTQTPEQCSARQDVEQTVLADSTDTKTEHQSVEPDICQAVLSVNTETQPEPHSVKQDVVEAVLTIHTEPQPELVQHDNANDNYPTAVIKTEDWVTGQESDLVLSKVRQLVAVGYLPDAAQRRGA